MPRSAVSSARYTGTFFSTSTSTSRSITGGWATSSTNSVGEPSGAHRSQVVTTIDRDDAQTCQEGTPSVLVVATFETSAEDLERAGGIRPCATLPN
jgi:hypothetical protein